MMIICLSLLFYLFFFCYLGSLIWEWGVVNDDEMRHVGPLTSAIFDKHSPHTIC